MGQWLDRKRSKTTGIFLDEQQNYRYRQDNFSDLLEEGSVFEATGRLDEALRCYERAVALEPLQGRGHFNRGNVLLELGRAEEALEAYDRALECKPDSAGGWSGQRLCPAGASSRGAGGLPEGT